MATTGIVWNANPQTFSDRMYPLFYAAYSQIQGSYNLTSAIVTRTADAHKKLEGKDVIDFGCGYGTTTRHLVEFAPRRIFAFDQSVPMIKLFHTVLDGNLDTLLNSAKKELGSLYKPCKSNLLALRSCLKDSIFERRGGNLQIKVLRSQALRIKEAFDAVLGNHSFHWPVEMTRNLTPAEEETPETRKNAIGEALLPFSRALRPNGIAVFSTMEDFVEAEDKEIERDFILHGTRSHPVLKKFETRVFERLLKLHGIKQKSRILRPKIFRLVELAEACQRGGFTLLEVNHQELAFPCDALLASVSGLPMLLGDFNITWKDKSNLMWHAYKNVLLQITDHEREIPIRVQNYCFTMVKH